MFKVDTRVKIAYINDSNELYNKTGIVLSNNTFFYNDHKVIVLLDVPMLNDDKAVIIHSMCLEILY